MIGNPFNWYQSVARGRGLTAMLKDSFSAALSPFRGGDADADSAAEAGRRASLAVVRMLLEDESGNLDPAKLVVYRQLLEGDIFSSEIDHRLAELRQTAAADPASLAAVFRELAPEIRLRQLRFWLALAAAVETPEPRIALLREISSAMEISAAEFDRLRAETDQAESRRRKIASSGAGIVAGLIVLAVFILTATLLRSVIFGLIIAYLLLPAEKYFERRLRRRTGIAFRCFQLLDFLGAPLRRLSERIRRRNPDAEDSPAEKELREERQLIGRAVSETVVAVLAVLVILAVFLSSITGRYVAGLGEKIRSLRHHETAVAAAPAAPAVKSSPAAATPADSAVKSSPAAAAAPAAPAVKSSPAAATPSSAPQEFAGWVGELFDHTQRFLETQRERFERLPLVKVLLSRVGEFLENPRTQQDFAAFLLRRSGGLFSFTANVLGVIGSLVCDLLLTVFFSLLFLLKLAEFCRDDMSSGRQSEYLVRGVFNGSWLPGANDATVQEAKRIVSGTFDRLRIWVRGYLTLVLVDSTVYTTVFWLLGVPYFPLLGFLAGCGIMLPYLGPVISCLVTVLVTLAVGNASGVQLAGIVIAYLLYNGVVEQFILYPAVIGESLGLTTLETIIVVLLGAIFAGIPGMILALPAASVLKYLVPQLYRCWGDRRTPHRA